MPATALWLLPRQPVFRPIDSVFSDVGDMEGLLNNVLSAKAMGFEGMGCIHTRAR
jgi:citrate lyase beta subunit